MFVEYIFFLFFIWNRGTAVVVIVVRFTTTYAITVYHQ